METAWSSIGPSSKDDSWFHDLRVPQVWVDYATREDVADDFVQSTWKGCSTPDVTGGFRLYCDYQFGNWNPTSEHCGTYYYRVAVWFYQSGLVRPEVLIYGPGYPQSSENYITFFRMDLDVNVSAPNHFSRWEGAWSQKNIEGNYPDDFANRDGNQTGYEWRVKDNTTRSYYVDPSGSDGKPGTGRGADMYVLHTNLGETEPADGEVGFLSQYMDPPENIGGLDITLWNVAYTPEQDVCVEGNQPPPLLKKGVDGMVPSGY